MAGRHNWPVPDCYLVTFSILAHNASLSAQSRAQRGIRHSVPSYSHPPDFRDERIERKCVFSSLEKGVDLHRWGQEESHDARKSFIYGRASEVC